MKDKRKSLLDWLKKRHIKGNPTKTIAVVFLLIILFGALLLSLPIASKDGQSVGFLDALFTATSSTCVTGLVMFDTATQWSGFGQGVILCLIEIGGLGFMSAASLLVFLLRRRISLRQRMVMAQALSLNEIEGVQKLQKWVLLGSLSVQAAGAIVLLLRFWPQYGFTQSLWWSVFHAVSAFCNAGFDVFGTGTSLEMLNGDAVVLVTLMGLIVIGGLGFFVWEELASQRSFKKYSVYTKLVLLTSAMLIIGAAVLILLLEWNNPKTLGAMEPGQKILNALFQAVTLRTAGFASFSQAGLTDAAKGISMLLMLIGGSSGSTAGGLKTVSFIVLLLFIRARIRGRSTVTVFKRTVPGEKVMDAMTIAVILVMLAFFGGIFISATSPVGFTDALFESVSALGTVGLTTGATTSLSVPAQILIVLYMYFGRVGVLTISLGFLMGDKASDRFRYANTNLLIG